MSHMTSEAIHTPNFQPPRGITPMTHTVLQHMENVARKPVIIFLVAMTSIGKARLTPIITPYKAFSANI